jgi:hypothetical protein
MPDIMGRLGHLDHEAGFKGKCAYIANDCRGRIGLCRIDVIFLMWMALQVNQIQCSRAALVALVFGLGSALSTSFLGGYAAAAGPVAIPYIGDKPINVALGGGILALVITTAMAWMVVKNNCEDSKETQEVSALLAECKVSPPHVRISCIPVMGLGQPPQFEGTLNVRSGPGLFCKPTNVLVNDDIAEVLATHGPWNYVRKLSVNSSGAAAIEGWVSVSFIATAPCPGAPQ